MASSRHAGYQARIKYLEQYDPDFVRQRRYFFVTCVIRGLFSGLQYGVLVPSAWAYLKIFNSPTWLYGLLLSCSKISGTCASLILGRLYDKTRRLKCILVTVNIIDIIGSLLYALPFSIWFLLIGRLFSGLGLGFGTATNSELAWITLEKDRTTIFARLMISFVMGILLGPPLAMLFQHIDLRIGDWHIDYRNVPGIISALLWIIMLPITWFLVNDLAKDYIDFEINESGRKLSGAKIIQNEEEACLVEEDNCTNSSHEIYKQNVTKFGEGGRNEEEIMNKDGKNTIQNEQGANDTPQLKDVIKEIFSPELLVLFVSNCFAYIYMFSVDTSIPLFTQEDFGWEVVYTSLVYVVKAIENLVIFVLLGVVGNKVSDSSWIIAGLFCMCTSSIMLLFYQYIRGQLQFSVPLYCLLIAVNTPFFPFFETGGRSLLTKIIPMHSQGVIQGAFDSTGNASALLGPFWGVYVYGHVYAVASASLLLIVICLVWFMCSLKRIKARKQQYGECKEVSAKD